MSHDLTTRATRLLPLLALLGALFPAARAAADTSLNGEMRGEMREVAKSVKQFLDDNNETAITVGQYDGPVDLPASSGPAIASALTDELKKLGVDVKVHGANFIVKGGYRLVEDGNSKDGLHAVAIESSIVNKKGEEVTGRGVLKPRGVYGDAAKAVLLGLTYSVPPAGDDKTRDTELQEAYENPPKPSLDKTWIKAGDAPFAVEIMVKEGDKFVPRAAKDVDGLAYVELKKDDVYRVRIYNDADYEVAAALSIDGLNIFQFSELRDPKNKQKPLYDQVLIKGHGAYEVRGWHRNNDATGSNEFQATKYADSETAQLYPYPAKVGTITATFGAAWPRDGAPPADEPKNPNDFARCADFGTHLGAETGDGYHEAERRFGVLRAAVSVRYSKNE